MIDLKKELKELKAKAKRLMTIGDLKGYFEALNQMSQLQLKHITVRK